MLTNLHSHGATSCTLTVQRLALPPVQDNNSQHAPSRCKIRASNMHRYGATQDYLPTYVGYGPHQSCASRTTETVMHCVQDGRIHLPNLTAPSPQPQPADDATTDRARGEVVSW